MVYKPILPQNDQLRTGKKERMGIIEMCYENACIYHKFHYNKDILML